MANKVIREWPPIPSSTRPNEKYVVKLHEDGNYSCNCPQWIFKKKNVDRICPHINAIKILDGASGDRPSKPEGANVVRRIRIGNIS